MSLRSEEIPGDDRLCDHPGCRDEGAFRAPVAPDRLREYYWFCKVHVRAYNASWSFHHNWAQSDIEEQIRSDTVWNRPSWPIGSRLPKSNGQQHGFVDPFDVYPQQARGADDWRSANCGSRRDDDGSAVSHYRALSLTPPVSLTALKARYKELAKRLHPDINGGDPAAEDRLKRINLAYAALKKSLPA